MQAAKEKKKKRKEITVIFIKMYSFIYALHIKRKKRLWGNQWRSKDR